MESIEDESVATTPPTDGAAVTINDGSTHDSTTAEDTNKTTTADEDIVISDDDNAIADVVTSPESHQMTGAVEGKEKTGDEAANNDIEEAALTSNDVDTTDSISNNEQTAQENIETVAVEKADPKSNDIDLLGFTDEMATNNFTTDTQVEMPSFPENYTIAKTASNDFDLLGFGAAELPQEDAPVDDNCAVDEFGNELGTEDGEKNDAAEQRPDFDAAAVTPVKTKEANGSDPISNQGDTDEADLIMSIANHIDKDTTVDINIPDVQDLLITEPDEPASKIYTVPGSASNEVDAEGSTQLNSEKLINNDSGVLEVIDTQPNNKDVAKPDSESIDQTQIETVEEAASPDVPNENGAGEDLLSTEPNEVSAATITLPESADNEVDAEDLTQFNSEEVINNNYDASDATDTLPNEKDTTTSDSETMHQALIEIAEETNSPNIRSESCAVENLLSVASDEPSAAIVSLPESVSNEVDADDSTQLNSEEVINNDSGVLEAIDTQPNGETAPSALEHANNKVSDAIDEEAQTNVHEMTPPSDEPTATFAGLAASKLAHLNVASENVDLISEAPDTQTNEVDNANIVNNIPEEEEEEGCDEVQNVGEGGGSNLTPVQNNEEGNSVICAPAEAHTEEEAEWLSMGLTLGDALRQIVALTDERDSAFAICQEKDDVASQAESLLVEVQGRLEAEMNRRAESDSKARKLAEQMNTYEERLKACERMEDELEAAQANIVTAVSEKSKLELEIAKLREVREESERKEAVLSNRLNEAKKKEANKSNTAGRLELDNEELRANLESTKAELESTSKAKAKLEGTMEKLKTKAVERVKQAETALKEERELNEQRKRKMKAFVETKAEELREAKESAGDMQKELQETRSSLTASREREESIQKDIESARIKYREVQRDMERMKRNTEALHSLGNNLEQELEKSANETEEHKKKRISAKHELMTMMRTLEVEKGVGEKLRESMKFTFAPKAQSQQQLLSECLRDLEQELDRLSIKLGKPLLPQTQTDDSGPSSPSKNDGGMERSESIGSGKKARRGRAAKADMDTERLISNLEQETQSVSKGIMALVSSIERMRILLDEDNTFNCMAFFSNHLGLTIGAGEARHQRLGDETTVDDNEEAVSITSFEQR